MKLLLENWRNYLNEGWEEEARKQAKEAGETGPIGVETFEDLKKLLKAVELKRKGGVAAKQAFKYIGSMLGPLGQAAVDVVENSKDMRDLLKSLYKADDSFKTQSGLDKLNVDDNVSKIVDDQVEAAFLKVLPKLIADKSGPIGDYNITKELQAFLASKFDKTTVKK